MKHATAPNEIAIKIHILQPLAPEHIVPALPSVLPPPANLPPSLSPLPPPLLLGAGAAVLAAAGCSPVLPPPVTLCRRLLLEAGADALRGKAASLVLTVLHSMRMWSTAACSGVKRAARSAVADSIAQ